MTCQLRFRFLVLALYTLTPCGGAAAQEPPLSASSGINIKLPGTEPVSQYGLTTFFYVPDAKDWAKAEPLLKGAGVYFKVGSVPSGVTIPGSSKKFLTLPGNDASNDAAIGSMPPSVTNDIVQATAFSDFLRTTQAERLICEAFSSLFSLSSSECIGRRAFNQGKSVFVELYISDFSRKLYEVIVFGSSLALALGEAAWTERHRFFISLGFDAMLQPYLTVFDYEPMYKLDKNWQQEDEKNMLAIDNSRTSSIRTFQEQVKTSLFNTIRMHYEAHLAALGK
jgi:hypothetical protein